MPREHLNLFDVVVMNQDEGVEALVVFRNQHEEIAHGVQRSDTGSRARSV